MTSASRQRTHQRATDGHGTGRRPRPRGRGVAILLGIGLLALGARLSYLRQIESIAFFHHPVGDAASYESWAARIAEGDWLGDDVFYQAPAYPYFLALVRALRGASLWAPRVAQAILGSLACLGIAACGWLWFGRGAGIAAGVLLALYAPAVFFDGLIQKASLGLFLLTCVLLLLTWLAWRSRGCDGSLAQVPGRSDRAAEVSPHSRAVRPPWMLACWAATGAVLGLLALTRENTLLLIAPVLLWLWIRFRADHIGRRIARSVALFGGMALMLIPVALRNYAVGGELAITTVQSGPNFYIGNSQIATGRYVPLRRGHESPPFERADAVALAQEAAGRPLDPGEVSRYWWRRSLDFIVHHPADWVALLAKKWLLVWNAYEIPDTESYSLYAAWSWLLGTLGTLLHFGVLCPLAVIGIALTWRRRRELWLLYGLIATIAVGVAAFYVVARYRYPLVPLLMLFAGAGIVEGWSAFRQSRRKRLAIALVLGCVSAVAVNLRISPERRLNAMAYANLGSTLAQQGNLTAAIHFFGIALEGAPDSAELHFNLGVALASEGRFADAVEHYRAALRFEPGLIHADYNLAVALEAIGQMQEAATHYRRALEVDPNDEAARRAFERLGASAPQRHRSALAFQAPVRHSLANRQ